MNSPCCGFALLAIATLPGRAIAGHLQRRLRHDSRTSTYRNYIAIREAPHQRCRCRTTCRCGTRTHHTDTRSHALKEHPMTEKEQGSDPAAAGHQDDDLAHDHPSNQPPSALEREKFDLDPTGHSTPQIGRANI